MSNLKRSGNLKNERRYPLHPSLQEPLRSSGNLDVALTKGGNQLFLGQLSEVVDADSCAMVDEGAKGQKQQNSVWRHKSLWKADVALDRNGTDAAVLLKCHQRTTKANQAPLSKTPSSSSASVKIKNRNHAEAFFSLVIIFNCCCNSKI